MMASLRHYRERLHKINYGGIKADQDPKILFDTIKRFIVGDLTNEFKDFRPGHFPTWAIYVSRVVYLKRRLGELGAPINDEAAVALVMEGVNHNHANLYGRLTRGMGRCDSKWSKLVEDLERVAAKYGGTAPLMCQDLRGLPSITAGFGKKSSRVVILLLAMIDVSTSTN
jgi:hypothetical protein